MQEKKIKGESIWGFLAILLVIFLGVGATLMKQQDDLNNVIADSNDIEYLSSSTQRLVRLILSEQNDPKLLSYLDEQTDLLLNVGNSSSISVLKEEQFKEMAEIIIYNWVLVKDLIQAEEVDRNTLLLAADNHFYQMTNLSDAINEYSVQLNHRITDSQYRIVILLLIFSIVILNNFLNYRTELKEKREQAKLALIDTATGLYNRSKCHELFRNSNHPGREHHPALIVFDLNDLKKTNDFQGHRMGDELIKSFANLLKSASDVHKIPPFIGRYGGDEFIVYYEDLESPEDLQYFLKELWILTKDFNEDERRFQISYAHGYKITQGEESKTLTVRQLFDLADESMYDNKKQMKLEQKEDSYILNLDESPKIQEEADDYDETDMDSAISSTDHIQSTHRKTKRMIVVALAVVAMYLFMYINLEKAKETYIGGNVIYLPVGSGLTQLERQPIGNPWNNGSMSSMLTFRALFVPNEDFTDVSPDFATNYQILDDGFTYVITLREDARWSDGVPMTAEDVVFSFESFLLCGNGNVNLTTAFSKIVGTEDFISGKTDHLEGLEVDGNVITIRLDLQHNTFMQMLAQFVPLPKHILCDEDLATLTDDIDFFYQPVCSGMYMVEGMDDDFNLILVKNPYYNDNTSDIEKIVMVWDYTHENIDYYSTSNITQMVSYRAMRGMDEYLVDVHFYRYFIYNMAGGYDAKTVEQLEAELLLTEENVAESVEIPVEEGESQDETQREENHALSDVRVRQAISHAINRPQLLSDLYFDTGKLTAGGPASTSDEEVFGYNPTLARQLLEEAGYDFNRVFTIAYYHSDTTTYIFLQQVKEYLEAVGLTVELVKSTTGNQFMYEDREYDMLLKGLSSFNTDDWYNEFLSTSGNISQLMGKKGEFDALVTALASSSSQEEYNNVLQKLMELEQNLMYKLPLFTLNESVYIYEDRISIPNDMVFSNTRYRSDIRFDEWYVKKG